MVILHIKRGEQKNEFLAECKTTQTTDEVLKEMVELHNLRIKVQRLAVCLRELSKHGPMRPEETRGLSENVDFPLEAVTGSGG